MTCTKRIVLTGYKVQYVDLREPKPRTIHEENYIVDQDWLAAAALMGRNVTDAIRERYECGGYRAFSVERIHGKQIVALDLQQLWAEAEPAIPADTSEQVCSGYHVETDSGQIVFKAATEAECEQYCDQAIKKGSAPDFLAIVENEDTAE